MYSVKDQKYVKASESHDHPLVCVECGSYIFKVGRLGQWWQGEG